MNYLAGIVVSNFIPVGILIIIYRLIITHSSKKRSISFYIRLFILGIFIFIISSIGSYLLSSTLLSGVSQSTRLYYFLDYFVIVAGIEEGSKFIGTFLSMHKDRETIHLLDYIFCAGLIALGFEVVENIGYILINNGFSTGLNRSLYAGHVCYGLIAGMFYAKAKIEKQKGKKLESCIYLFIAILLPIIFHGAFDYSNMVVAYFYDMLALYFIPVLEVIVYATDIAIIIYCVKYDKKLKENSMNHSESVITTMDK